MCRVLFSVCALALFCLLPAGAVSAAEADPWRAVFATPEDLAGVDEPIVCILTIQHPDIIRKQLADKPVKEYSGLKLRERIEQQSGLRCILVHFTEVRGEDLDRDHVKAILITGRSRTVSRELDARFYPLIRDTSIPIFGFCGGMQMIGQAYSARVGPLRKLRDGEADPHPAYHPGQFKEWGFLPVQIVRRDPLFDGLPDEIVVRQAHAFQVMQVPEEMELLASSPECTVQAFKHRRRLVYGTQFHPEIHDDQHPHGGVVVENFFRLVRAAATAAVEEELVIPAFAGSTPGVLRQISIPTIDISEETQRQVRMPPAARCPGPFGRLRLVALIHHVRGVADQWMHACNAGLPILPHHSTMIGAGR